MIASRLLPRRKRIAMVAHDNRKQELIEWSARNKDMLARHELIGTGTTGRLLEENLQHSRRKDRRADLFLGPHGSPAPRPRY
jgi:methylglyoxal synthase